jgi:hypothetical protein
LNLDISIQIESATNFSYVCVFQEEKQNLLDCQAKFALPLTIDQEQGLSEI